MIPPLLSPGCASPGERDIFYRLKDDPQTQNWTVLHSLDIAHHTKQISGEADFIILVPGKGVLCLEVKACLTVRREGGLWYYGAENRGDPRGPFKQGSEAMHSIRQRLCKLRPNLSGTVFWSAVMFPYLDFRIESGEWHPWQVIDRTGFMSGSVSRLLEKTLDTAKEFLKTRPSAFWFNPMSLEPTQSRCDEIATILRPSFEFFESPKSREYRINEELKRYTTAQFVALDAMQTNPRVVFQGPAGTGKTLLALEAARRAKMRGKRVLLLCYNRLLGNWLRDQAAPLAPEVKTSTIHSHMHAVSGLSTSTLSPDQQFWDDQLPSIAVDKLLATSSEEFLYDELVIDESQDILRDGYLDFLDLSLKGGLAAGRWMMFGDFEKQAIFGSGDRLSLPSFLSSRCTSAPIFSLRVNCRNTPRIAEAVHLLGGLNPGYSQTLRPDDGVEPDIRYYDSEQDQQRLLVDILARLRQEEFKGSEIMVLSPKASGSCAEGITTPPWNDRLRPISVAKGGQIRYTTIHSYKGLEAPAVVVIDINQFGDDLSNALFYIAMTRALNRLVILASKHIKPGLLEALLDIKSHQSG